MINHAPDGVDEIRARRRRAKKLLDLNITEVSGVDHPANDSVGGWLVAKSVGAIRKEPHMFEYIGELEPAEQMRIVQAEAEARAYERGTTTATEVVKMLATPAGGAWYHEHGRAAGAAWEPPQQIVKKTAYQEERLAIFQRVQQIAMERYPDLTPAQAVESVARALRTLRAEGLIATERRRISIRDREELVRFID